MATTINTHANWATATTDGNNNSTWKKILAFADSQAQYKTAWFLLALLAQGVLMLPVPAVLIYYYNAPITVLGITMVVFFSNIIAGMGGSGIRTVILFFTLSIAIHLLMLAAYIL